MRDEILIEEVAEYLVASGYSRIDQYGRTEFYKLDKAISISADRVEFFNYDEGEPGQRKAGMQRTTVVTGLSHLETFADWVFLMHIGGAVHIGEFKDAALAVVA